jgi:hypothetical protein
VKKKLLASALLACSLVTLGAVSAARAEPAPNGTTVLETVDSATTIITSSSDSVSFLRVEGIVEGETEPRELDLRFPTGVGGQQVEDRCLKFLLIAQSHPGRYKVEIAAVTSGSITTSVRSCKLKSR